MYSLLANDTAESLRLFLSQALPEIEADWWNRFVTPSLSFQQQRMVEEKKVSTLAGCFGGYLKFASQCAGIRPASDACLLIKPDEAL